jgi:hypothetical protein
MSEYRELVLLASVCRNGAKRMNDRQNGVWYDENLCCQFAAAIYVNMFAALHVTLPIVLDCVCYDNLWQIQVELWAVSVFFSTPIGKSDMMYRCRYRKLLKCSAWRAEPLLSPLLLSLYTLAVYNTCKWCCYYILYSMVWVRERTIPTERPPFVGEVIAIFFCG